MIEVSSPEAIDNVSCENRRKSFGTGGLNLADSRAARWASLDSDDRKVFNIWAARVAVVYSLLIISILGAILLGAYAPLGPKHLLASRAIERSSTGVPAPAPRSIGK